MWILPWSLATLHAEAGERQDTARTCVLLWCLSHYSQAYRDFTSMLSTCCSLFLFFLNKFIYLFIYFWVCWVFVSVRGLSLVAASGGHSSSRCAGLSLSQPLLLRPLLLRSTGSRRAGSVVVAHWAQLLRGMWDLPRPGLEPASPALASRFSTTAPPGKPCSLFLLCPSP